MSLVRFLIAWANSPFAIAGGITFLFALLQATGLLGLLAGGGDHDGHDVDGDAEADADADHDADHDADNDADNDSDAERGLGSTLAAPLGFGRIPFSLIWQVYAVVFAVTGLVLNARYFPAVPPVVSLAWTLPGSLLSGYAAVATLARLLGPVFATKAQEATSRAELVGQLGLVISTQVTEDFGEVRIRDKSGHDVRVVCKLARGSRRVRATESVVVVEYDEPRGILLVAPLESDASLELIRDEQLADNSANEEKKHAGS